MPGLDLRIKCEQYEQEEKHRRLLLSFVDGFFKLLHNYAFE